MTVKFNIDTSELDRYINKQLKAVDVFKAPKSAVKAVKQIMFDWQKIAGGGGENADQGAPIDTGLLRSSASTGVQGKFHSKSPNITQGDEKPVINTQFPKPGKFEILAQIGFNTDYAAKVHETFAPAGPIQPRIAGRGKFVEAAASENAKKWGRFLAKKIKEGIESK